MPTDNGKSPLLTVNDAVRLSGLSVHMIAYLGRINLVEPNGGGRGKARRFSFGDILLLRVISELLGKGIEVKRLKKSLSKIKFQSAAWSHVRRAPAKYLVTDGTEVFIRQQGELESKTMNGQLAFAFVLDLESAHRDIADSWPDVEKQKRQAPSIRATRGGRARS